MENDLVPQWYVAFGKKYVGPMTAAEVFEKIRGGEISFAHFVLKQGEREWKRICDVPAFSPSVPEKPKADVELDASIQLDIEARTRMVKGKSESAASPAKEKKAGPPPAPTASREEEKIWFLYYSDTQFGPFGYSEVVRFLKIGKIHGGVHAWREGMENWQRLERVTEFKPEVESLIAKGEATPTEETEKGIDANEKRVTPRRPLVARILMAHDDSVITGMCRDISIGGMQVLTDKVPGKAGTRLRLNVSPSGEERDKGIQPFVAEGVIVRVLEDGRGFSFRFEKLTDNSRKAIEKYIATSA